MGADPFRPYNAQYDAFVFPVAPGPLDAGFNSGLRTQQGVRGANQFENYLNSLQGTGSHAGAGTPYYRANRKYDAEFGREYRPNKGVDAQFDTNQELVTKLYFDYLRERDPQKRTEIFKNYNRARSQADRDLVLPRGKNRKTTANTSRRGSPSPLGTDAAGSADRGLGSAPSAVSSERKRSGSAATKPASGSAVGPAPTPLGGSASEAGTTHDASPSQILDRATRSERSRLAPRVPGLGTAPPPAP
jgi:hypothetical protein